MLEYAPSAPQWLGDYMSCIDAEILDLFGGNGSALHSAATDSLSKGKRVRAILALLWCEAISSDYKTAIPVAVAYELAHASALVQDDIIDHSEMRRGEKSIVSKYGLPEAILAANMLLSFVPGKISQYATSSGEMIQKLFELLGESYGASVWGEYLDLEMSRRESVTEKDYESMIRSKTGALVGASSASGAIVGGGLNLNGIVDSAFRFGELIGMAYQVKDDLLDVTSNEGVLGKPAFADIRRGKKNIVLLHSMKSCSAPDQQFLVSLLGRNEAYGEEEIGKARDLFDASGSISYAHKIALRYTDEAQKILDIVDNIAIRRRLLELSDYLSQRKY